VLPERLRGGITVVNGTGIKQRSEIRGQRPVQEKAGWGLKSFRVKREVKLLSGEGLERVKRWLTGQ
jgi:hypothetical protein